MYYYIYDSYLNSKSYNNTLAKIETRLTDLGINGKINHLSFLKNIKQILTDEIKKGANTLVVVGNDKTIGKIINLVADLNMTLGIIPIDGTNNIAKFLGIPLREEACDILSSRIVQKIDLGNVNNNYFISSIETIGKNISLELDNNYLINLEGQESIINVSNLNCCFGQIANPEDQKLDIFIQIIKNTLLGKKEVSFSHLKSKLIKITSSKTIPILLSDEKKIVKTPANIKIVGKKIKMIVGKNRIQS